MARDSKGKVYKIYERDSNKRVAIISWYDRDPSIDIRYFTESLEPGKGIILSIEDIDDIVKDLILAKHEFYKLTNDKDEEIDKTEYVDLMDHLVNVEQIVGMRLRGIATKDGKRMVILTKQGNKLLQKIKDKS